MEPTSHSSLSHSEVIASFSDMERARLREKSDFMGLVHLAGHFGLIAGTGFYISFGLPGWQIALVLHGIFIVFLFTLLHETAHDTPFASPWLNRMVGTICGFVIGILPTWFRYFHLAHHRHTHDPAKDPELEDGKPETMGDYIRYLSGIPIWLSLGKTIFNVAFGENRYDYVPGKAKQRTAIEARTFLILYGLLLIAGFVLQLEFLLWLWILPLLVGQPFLRSYLLAEHTLCPHVSNMLENTRTTLTNRFIHFIAWNMPYHSEHHSYPVVPFHKLPDMHRLIADKLVETENGYGAFHRKMVANLRGKNGSY